LELVVVALLDTNGAGSSSIGARWALWSKQVFDGHQSTLACGGTRQLQPIKVVDTVPMSSVLMQFPPREQSSARILAAVKYNVNVDYLFLAQKY
jgi:hypothetical protein